MVFDFKAPLNQTRKPVGRRNAKKYPSAALNASQFLTFGEKFNGT